MRGNGGAMQYQESVDERVAYEMARARRYGLPLTVALFSCSQGGTDPHRLPAEIGARVRCADIVKPMGGNVVIALLPHTGLDGGIGFARRMLGDLERIAFCDPRAGLSCLGPHHQQASDLVDEVRAALDRSSADSNLRVHGEEAIKP